MRQDMDRDRERQRETETKSKRHRERKREMSVGGVEYVAATGVEEEGEGICDSRPETSGERTTKSSGPSCGISPLLHARTHAHTHTHTIKHTHTHHHTRIQESESLDADRQSPPDHTQTHRAADFCERNFCKRNMFDTGLLPHSAPCLVQA
jgi:hypothetical protein